jgi:hypothetical protein
MNEPAIQHLRGRKSHALQTPALRMRASENMSNQMVPASRVPEKRRARWFTRADRQKHGPEIEESNSPVPIVQGD